jgi:predicted Zn-dependent peptidase
MVNLALVILGSLLYGASPAPVSAEVFGPLFVSRDRDGPLLVVREQKLPPLIAIRLSVPVEEPPGLAGAGRVLQLLVQDRLHSEVERFGGRIEFLRTPGHLVYSVRGPATAFGEMVAVLRYAVAPPPGAFRAQAAVWLTARQEALADFETPDRLLRYRLERALFPDLAKGRADFGSADLPNAADLEWYWRHWFRPTRMAVVIAGAVEAEVARAAFRGWPEPPAARSRPPARPVQGAAPVPEVISARTGLAYATNATEPAVLALAAALIDETLPAPAIRQATAELWWVGDRSAVVVMGAAPTGSQASAAELRARLQLSVADAAARATAADIARLGRRLRQSLLMRARTPAGMAAVLGEFLDRTGDPASAEEFLEALERVEAEAVREALRILIYRAPVVVELEP